MTRQTKGMALMVATVFCFAVQDGFSRKLAGDYNTFMVVMVRYWVFAAFVTALALRRPEGWAAVRTRRLPAHFLRGMILVLEICGMVYGYTKIGLIQCLAIFAVSPLIVVALSGPILGERLTTRAKLAVALGCLGVLVILKPGAGVFSWYAVLPLASAALFALYAVLTRLTAREEPFFPAFFWPPIFGAVLATALGLPHWQGLAPQDWGWMALYAGFSVLANWLMQKTYQTVEAASVQPFSYLHIVFVSVIGVGFFGEVLLPQVVVGTAIVVAAGLYTLMQARR